MSPRYQAVVEACEPYLVASFLGAAAQPRPGPPGVRLGALNRLDPHRVANAPFLTLFAAPTTLIIGFSASFLVALLSIAWSIRGLTRLSPRSLLAGTVMYFYGWSTLMLIPIPFLIVICIALVVLRGNPQLHRQGPANA